MENKEIRFIDSSYNELFRIPDGGYITVKTRDGAVTDRKCKYIDDYHTQIGYNVFHICQFAELMERGGNIYRPKDTPDLKLERISQEEFEFTFAPKDKEQNRGCICYIRGYFDNSIDERFQSSAMIESRENYKKYKTNDFSRELDNIINYFRFQADTPILKSRAQMRLASADTEHLVSDDNVFGYKVNTDTLMFDEHRPEDIDTKQEDHIADETRYICMANPMKPIKAEIKEPAVYNPLDSDDFEVDRYAFYRKY